MAEFRVWRKILFIQFRNGKILRISEFRGKRMTHVKKMILTLLLLAVLLSQAVVVVSAADQFTVKYDLNGGDGDVPEDSEKYDEGATVTVLFDPIPEKEGHTFLGWDRNKKNTTPEFTEDGEDTFEITEKTTLYAVWDFGFDEEGTTQDKKIDAVVGKALNVKAAATNDCDFVWKLTDNDGDEVDEKTDDGIKSTYNYKIENAGKYTLTLTITSEDDEEETREWKITAEEESSAGSDRIWTEEKYGDQDSFTWDFLSFSGFYYDIDNGQGTEYLKLNQPVSHSNRKIKEGNLIYRTESASTKFEYSAWGSYEVIGFMAEEYFGGYTKDSASVFTSKDLVSDGMLLKVLKDEDEKYSLKTGSMLELGDGCSLKIVDIDINGDKVIMEFLSDGVSRGTATAKSGETATFETKIDGDKVTILAVYVDNVFQGAESSVVTINGVFQLSENPIKIDDDYKVDSMEVKNYGKEGNVYFIEMENHKDITLSNDRNVTLMGKIFFEVANNTSSLRFAPSVNRTAAGTYQIRGTAYDKEHGSEVKKWDGLNFEGMYYDMDEDTGVTETLEIKSLSGRTIENNSIIYRSEATDVDFERGDWGSYTIISFMGQKYFAGYTSDSGINNGKSYSLVSDGNLSKVLMDDDEKYNLRAGEALTLGDGYSLKATDIDINGEKVIMTLLRDGSEVATATAKSGETARFEERIGDEKITMVAVYVSNVFQGSESSVVTTEGIFQISDRLTKIEEDQTFGKMEVDSFSSNEIVLKSRQKITLSKGKNESFMQVGNTTMYFRVGDSDDLRFYPYTELVVGGNETQALSVSFTPSATVKPRTNVTISVKSNGSAVSDATIKLNGSLVGTTDENGNLSYTPDTTGRYIFTAEKKNYKTSSSAVLTVQEDSKAMTITVNPSSVFVGDEAIITVTDSASKEPLSGAAVNISGTMMATNATGQVSYIFNTKGTISVTVTMAGYSTASTPVSVKDKAASFTVTNVTISDERKAGKSIEVSADVTNAGLAEGEAEITLTLTPAEGEPVVETKTLTLGANETTVYKQSFKLKEAGDYTVTLTCNGDKVNIPSDISKITIEEGSSGNILKYILIFIVIVILVVILVAGAFFAFAIGKKRPNQSVGDAVREAVNGLKRR